MRYRYFVRRVLGPVVGPFVLFVLKRMSTYRTVLGVDLWLAADTVDRSLLFDRITDALHLVEQWDKPRFTRIQRYLGSIVILEGTEASHLPSLRICVLGAITVLDGPVARLAATLVHEATHARIRTAGVPLRLATIAREEVLCSEESIRCLQRLPGGEYEANRRRQILDTELKKERPWFYATFH